MTKSDSEWDQRILCSDGNCIGIIGADGCCKVCNLPYEGKRPLPAATSNATDDNLDDLPADQQIMEEDNDVGDEQEVGTDESEDSWENRTLCIDESCIGVVGPDGCCKECGKTYPGQQ